MMMVMIILMMASWVTIVMICEALKVRPFGVSGFVGCSALLYDVSLFISV